MQSNSSSAKHVAQPDANCSTSKDTNHRAKFTPARGSCNRTVLGRYLRNDRDYGQLSVDLAMLTGLRRVPPVYGENHRCAVYFRLVLRILRKLQVPADSSVYGTRDAISRVRLVPIAERVRALPPLSRQPVQAVLLSCRLARNALQ
jgi:hypothetical protein